MSLNETHDTGWVSWVSSAQQPGCDFPIQNLPHAVFRRSGSQEAFRGGVAIGDSILDLAAAFATGTLEEVRTAAELASRPTLNAFMAAGPAAWSALRLALSRALRQGSASESQLKACLVPQAQAEYAVPACIGDYTDFYASIHHATAVGRLFRPDNPLLPNYKWLPVAYHGRSSSVCISGTAFHRPKGQVLGKGATAPTLIPSARLDYELEIGAFIGPGNERGDSIELKDAEGHIFGLCLLNDWSARDLQVWEYQPLGPFLAKSFATTISPWIVTLEALEPYRGQWQRPPGDPAPLPYLDAPSVRTAGVIDIQLEAYLQTDAMRRASQAPCRLSRSSFRDCYWTLAHMVAHHTVNGCGLRPGDLLGTGTQSGPHPAEAGSLVELSRGGSDPVCLPGGETRLFLEDGDTVTLRGFCERAGAARIGFGEAVGKVLPARSSTGART